MSADIINFPGQECDDTPAAFELTFEIAQCPICKQDPSVRRHWDEGYAATCFCEKCGAGSLPKGLFYGSTGKEAITRAIVAWNERLARSGFRP